MILRRGESIVAVVAEECSGPGWTNAPYWVYIREVGGTIREECLQPSEQGNTLLALHKPAAAMQKTLKAYVLPLVRVEREGE